MLRKSCASFITVCPCAWVANTAIIGISSISFGISSPEISQPCRFGVYLIFKSPTGSEHISFLSRISMFAPIFCATSSIPARVGFRPTFFKIISEFGTIKPAAMKYAAEDISPIISILSGERFDLDIEI